MNLRRFLLLTLVTVTLVAVSSDCYGQDSDADRARTLLKQGIGRYKALEFQEAKAAFLKVSRADLSAADKSTLDQYMVKGDSAIKRQMTAMAAYMSAERALKAGDLGKASEGFMTASASEYLPAAVRQDAKAQLAVVASKQRAAKAKAASVAAEAEDIGRLLNGTATEPVASEPAPVVKPAETHVEKAVAVSAGTHHGNVVAVPLVIASEPKPVSVKQVAVESVTKRGQMLSAMEARNSKVSELMALGQQAIDNNQSAQAVGYFQRAVALAPENSAAKSKLLHAKQLASASGDTGIIGRVIGRIAIERQVANAEFDKALTRSRESLTTADSSQEFDAAFTQSGVAQNVIDTKRNLFSKADYDAKSLEVANQREHIDMVRTEWEIARVQMQVVEIELREAERRATEDARRSRQIEVLTERAITLRQEEEFRKAQEVTRQILVIDPGNSWAADQVESLDQTVMIREQRRHKETQRYQELEQSVKTREEEIPWVALVNYPDDWKELTIRREGQQAEGSAESPEDKEVRKLLRTKLPPMAFDDTEFQEVIGFLRESTEANIHVKWNVLILDGIEKTTRVSNITLKGVTFDKGLRTVLEDVGGPTPLDYIVDEGVITISTADDLARVTSVKTYDIRDLILQVPDFDAPLVQLGSNGNNGSNNGTNDNDDNNDFSRGEIVQNIMDMIVETIAPDTWPPINDVGSIREMQGQLIVKQTAKNHNELMNLLRQLRESRALQVSIEARFISVSTGFLNSIGLDLDFFFNLGSSLTKPTTADPWTGAGVPGINGSTWENQGHSVSGNNKFTPLAMKQSSMGFANMLGVGGIGAALVGSPAFSFGGTFLDDIQVDFLIEATQANESTRTLTAPRVTLYNGQKGYINVSTSQAYVSDLTPIVADNAVAFNPVVSAVSTGTSLEVRPTVSADRRYVTLTLEPRVSLLNGFTTYAVTVASTGANGQPLTGSGFIQQPNVSIQALGMTVSVPDGGTLLLGGQKRSTEVEREQGVPLLNKIPIISRAFNNRGMVREEETLLILVRPKIIIQSEEEERQHPN